MPAAFDTLEIAKRLRNAGFTEPQAEAVTGVLRDAREADLSQLATKSDLPALKSDLARVERDLKSDMAQLATKADFGELKAQIVALRTEMEIMRRDLTIR